MRRLAVAGVAALALVAAGCGSSRRDAVNAYLKHVDAVEHELAPRVRAANAAYGRFGKALESEKERRALVRAEATVRELRDRLAAVDPPEDAERLHALLLQLVGREAAFANEVLLLAGYIPRFQALVLDAGQAGRRLQAVLHSRSAAEAAPAFGRYAAALETDLRKLELLQPPPAMAPSHQAGVTALRRTADISRRLRLALEREDNAAAGQLATRLTGVSSFAVRERVAAAERHAVLAYNERLVDLGRLAARIQRERIRLDRKL